MRVTCPSSIRTERAYLHQLGADARALLVQSGHSNRDPKCPGKADIALGMTVEIFDAPTLGGSVTRTDLCSEYKFWAVR